MGKEATPRCAVLALALLAVLVPAPASAQETLSLQSRTTDRGYVGLTLHAAPGAVVTITELAGQTAEPIASVTVAAPDTELPRAVAWRCDRRVRVFVATAADGSTARAEARTPSCRRRLDLDAPARARPGRAVRVRLRDRWGLGDATVRLCVRPPGGPGTCDDRRIGADAARERVAVKRPGTWRVRAQAPWDAAERDIRVARRGGRLRLLVTGDSMIQPLDDFLRQRLRSEHVRVTSDPRISTGISKPSLLNWPAHARSQARSVRPDVTVVFLGANDGFPMGDAPCCGEPWVHEYADRAGGMIESYARGGRGRVYWLALPAPRGGFFRQTFPAVNAALRRATAADRADARLIRLDRFFTPGGRYRDTMRIGGRSVHVRQRDGVHLSAAGASAAAGLIIRALRRERIVA
jgi:lysophospholipase L1-like esterase